MINGMTTLHARSGKAIGRELVCRGEYILGPILNGKGKLKRDWPESPFGKRVSNVSYRRKESVALQNPKLLMKSKIFVFKL